MSELFRLQLAKLLNKGIAATHGNAFMAVGLLSSCISLSRIQGNIILGFTGIKLHRLQPYIPEPNRTESSISAVNSVRLVYYSNRTLSSASIGTSIRFGSRSKISSREAIRLANARYGSRMYGMGSPVCTASTPVDDSIPIFRSL